MPQEFDQAQSASAGQEVGDIVESAGVQVDGTTDALDAVLDDIQSVLESNPRLRLMREHCVRFILSPVFSALKPIPASV